MKSALPALPALAIVLLGGLAAVFWWSGGSTAVPDLIDPEAPAVRFDAEGRPVLEVRTAAPVDARPVAARYRLVDGQSGAPIAGGRVMRVGDGAVLGATDGAGFVDVADGRINTVAFGAAGYLLEHFFDRPEQARALVAAAARAGHVRVLLTPDDFTLGCRVRFLAPDGSAARGVRCRFLCLEEPAPDPRSVPESRLGAGAAIPPELRAAWLRHAMLGTLTGPDFSAGSALHFGAWSRSRTYACDGEIAVRFLAPGGYRVEAGTATAFRRQGIDVQHGREVVVQLREGAVYAGQVVDRRDGTPVPGAGVSLQIGDAIQASDLTDAAGRFRLGPLPRNAMALVIHHPAFTEVRVPGVRPGDAAAVHRLAAKDTHRVAGVVRRRPDLAPVAGAEVRLLQGAAVIAETQADARGAFHLASFALEPTLEIAAPGYLDYAESLNANGEVRDFDLLPATAAERVRRGLSAIVHGRVLDGSGKPVAGRGVQARPVQEAPADGVTARRILRGGRLVSQRLVVTDAAGRFELEWVGAEDVRVVAPLARGEIEDAPRAVVRVVPGRTHEVVLRDPR